MATYSDTLYLKDKVSRSLEKISRKLGVFEKRAEKARKRLEYLNKTGEKLKGLGTKLTVGLTLPIVALGAASLKAASDFEKMQEQLSIMLGSAEKGKKMFNDITKFASQTPLETKDIMQATNTMLSFGIASDKVLEYQRQLGDIAGGNAERFRALSLAFSQASSAGKLQGQDLMQMINAGFNPLEQIAKRTGKTVGYWKEQMSKGKVTMDMVTQAMKDATSEGGRYHNMMLKMSKTAGGQLSTLQDNWNMALANFGKEILPLAIKGMSALSKILEKINSMTPAQKKFLVVVASIVAIIGPLVAGIGTVITTITSLSVAAGALGISMGAALGIVAGIPLAIAAVVTALVLLWKNWSKIWNGIKSITMRVINGIVGFINKLLEKLGFLAYLIPGLAQIKIGKDIAGAVGGAIEKNSVRQSQTNNTSNTTNNTTNFFGNIVASGKDTLDKLIHRSQTVPAT
jgi:tape measure domain-containing protein